MLGNYQYLVLATVDSNVKAYLFRDETDMLLFPQCIRKHGKDKLIVCRLLPNRLPENVKAEIGDDEKSNDYWIYDIFGNLIDWYIEGKE